MINQLFLGFTLLGSEWVLILLIILSILSIGMTLERWNFYRKATLGLPDFRARIRHLVSEDEWKEALDLAEGRLRNRDPRFPDLETELSVTLLRHMKQTGASSSSVASPNALNQLAEDVIVRARIPWDKYLSVLASIGSNTPFFGLFGTVLGIIRAFHELSAGGATGGQGATQVSTGISEALVATAIGLFVAIPAVISYNSFQRRVKTAAMEAEALKSFLIGSLLK